MKNILPILFFAAAFTASAQTVTLDETFEIGAGVGYDILEIQELSDGKVMIAGDFATYNGTYAHGIARLHPDGSIDTTFEADLYTDLVTGLIMEDDDKMIVLSGLSGLCRLNPDGSKDETFQAFPSESFILSYIIKQGDKYLVSGVFTKYSENIMYQNLIRINNDGSVDNTFASTSFPNYYQNANLFLQDDGKIIVFGKFNNYNGVSVENIIRLNADGSHDATFVCGGANTRLQSVAQQADGKLIVTGYFQEGQSKLMKRLNSDGSIDDTFAYSSNVGLPEDGILGYDIVIQEDGKILMGGAFHDAMEDIEGTPDGSVPVNLVRLHPDGSNDETFSLGVGFNGAVFAIALQENGKIYAGGSFYEFNGIEQNGLARLNVEELSTQDHTADGLLVYPNPVQERLFVTAVGTATIKLIDLTGKIVIHTTAMTSNGLNVSGLAPGIYFAEITTGDSKEVKKIIKQ